MIENVTKRGYQSPTAIQMQAIPLMVHVSVAMSDIFAIIYLHAVNVVLTST